MQRERERKSEIERRRAKQRAKEIVRERDRERDRERQRERERQRQRQRERERETDRQVIDTCKLIHANWRIMRLGLSTGYIYICRAKPFYSVSQKYALFHFSCIRYMRLLLTHSVYITYIYTYIYISYILYIYIYFQCKQIH